MRINGATLAKQWGIDCESARYSAWGNWYARETGFPLALLDSQGYAVFASLEDLQSTPGVRVTKQINIKNGISSLDQYRQCNNQPPEEVDGDMYNEGEKITILVNRYERNSEARTKCLQAHGFRCTVCNWSGVDTYGDEAINLIHVHHLKPLGEMGTSYELDPINDLCPICPNCHAFIHSFKPALSIEAAKKRLGKKEQQ